MKLNDSSERAERFRVAAGSGVLLLTLVLLTLEVTTGFASHPDQAKTAFDLVRAALILASPVVFSLIGCLVVVRRPRNTVGWMLCAVGLSFMGGIFLSDFPQYLYNVRHDRGPFMIALAVMSNGIWPLFITCLGVLLQVFPTGRPLSRGWAWILRASLAVSAAVIALLVTAYGKVGFVPVVNPIGLPLVNEEVGGNVFMLCLLILFASLISVGRRFWVSRGEERQQLKWLTYSAVFAVVLYINGILDLPGNGALEIFYFISISMIPVSIGVAILKYRLYDIDVLINRTLVYGLLTASLGGFYLGAIIVLQGLFRTGTGQSSDLAIVVATLTIAALFNPWRKRLQTFIDRRFYRRKYDAARALASLQAKLRDEVDLDRLTAEVLTVVQGTVEPRHVSLWLQKERVS